MPDDSTFLVTGATGYVGQALVAHFAQRPKTRVLACARGQGSRLSALRGQRVEVLPPLDLSVPEEANELASQVESRTQGRFHIVNCTGFFPGFRRIAESHDDDAVRSMTSNYLTVYNTARALLPVMRSRGGGHFIAFGSHSGYQAFPLMAAFDAAKAAVQQLIRHISNEESESGIVANCLCPATLDTDAERKLKPFGDHDHWIKPHEIARFIERIVASGMNLLQGNELHLYRHSETYFHQAYYDRIRTKPLADGGADNEQSDVR